MNTKVLFTLLVCISLVPAVAADAHAFSLFGIDFGGVTEFVAGIFSSDSDKEEVIEEKTNTNKASSSTNKTKKPPVDYEFTIAGTTYKESVTKSIVNSDPSLTGYVQSFGYDCIALSINPSPDLTVTFNTETGKIKKIRGGLNCDTEIGVEESLILDIQENGFQASKAGDYISQADIPASVYFKALRVFTVG